MDRVLDDEVWWTLLLSEAAGPVTLPQLRRWSMPDIVQSLVVAEAIESKSRYEAAMAGVRHG